MKSFRNVLPLAAFLLLRAAAPGFCASYGASQEMHFDESDKVVEKRLDLLNKKVDLSPTQLFNVKTALNEEMTQLDLLKKEVQEARKKIIDETDGKMMGILTPQQQENYKKIKPDVLGKTDSPPFPAGENHTER